MTQDEIIEMAQECNLIGMRPHLDGIYSEALVAFANFVAAKEREACAKVCEFRIMGDNNREDLEAQRCADAIRARGEQA